MAKLTKELKESQDRLRELVARLERDEDSKPKTLAEVERDSHEKLIASCKAKIARGEKPARHEMRAWQVEEDRLTAEYGGKYVGSLPQKTYIEWAELNARIVYSHGAEFRLPIRGKHLDLRAIVKRIHELLKDGSLANESKGNMESPSIERQRCARADEAEDNRDERRGQLIPRDVCRRVHTVWAKMLRDAGETLGRKHGSDAQDILNEALDDCEQLVADNYGEDGVG